MKKRILLLFLVLSTILIALGTREVKAASTSCPNCGRSVSNIIAKSSSGHTWHCNVYCSYTWTENHSWSGWKDNDSSTEKRSCTKCGYSETRGHSFYYKDLGNGTHQAVCDCGRANGSAKAHVWNSGVVSKEPTATEEGVRTYSCTTCSAKKTETIPVLHTHSWDNGTIITAATCTTTGEMLYQCSGCSETKTETILATGHNWDDGVVQSQATCTEAGMKLFTCKNDATHTRTEVVDALGHNPSEYKTTAREHWKDCTRCGEEIDNSRGDHSYPNDDYICSTCGYELTVEAPTIETETEWENEDVDATIIAGDTTLAFDKLTYILSGSTEVAETEIESNGTITISNEGETTITAYTYDEDGHKSKPATKVVKIDKVAPAVTFSVEGTKGKVVKEATTVITVEDLGADIVSGVNRSSLKYKWTTSAETPDFADGTAFESGETVHTPTDVVDNFYLWVYAEDNAGNIAIVRSADIFMIDNVAPKAPRIVGTNKVTEENIPSGETVNKDVLVQIIPDLPDDIVVVTIKKDGTDVTASIGKYADGRYILKENGEYEVIAFSRDEYGNDSENVIYKVTINHALPDAPELKAVEEPHPEVEVPDGGETKEPVKPLTDEDEPGETTTIKIIDEDGNDRTDDFTNPDTGDIVIDESGDYDIIATTVNDDEPENKTETTIHVRVDVDAPEVQDDTKVINQGETVNDQLNATDNYGVVEFEVTQYPTHGSFVMDNQTGEYTYTPDEEFYGEVNFKIVAKDEVGNVSDEATITIVVKRILNVPTIVGVEKESGEKVPNESIVNKDMLVEVKADHEDDILVITVKKDGTDVTDSITKDADGKYILDEDGKYEITAKATDGLGTETAEVTYTVTINHSAPDEPKVKVTEEPNPDVEVPDGGETKEPAKVETDDDEPGETTTIKIIDEDGDDRTDDFMDPDTEEIVIDESGDYDIIATTVKDDDPENKSEITVHVRVDVDAPEVQDDEKETEFEQPVDGEIEATDNYGVTGYDLAAKPKHGKVTLNKETGEYTYTPNTGYVGEDEFKVVAKDEVGNISEKATIKVLVTKKLEESDLVTEREKSIIVYKNQEYSSKVFPKADRMGASLTYTIKTVAENGTVTFDATTRKFTYVPNKDYLGKDSFVLEVTNGTETINITFNITVKTRPTGGSSSGNKEDDKGEEHTWYIRGYEDGTIRADGQITREEIAMMIYRLSVGPEGTRNISTTARYSDVQTDRWSYDAIMYLSQKGILKGYGDGTFKPQVAISRAELASIICRFIMAAPSKNNEKFQDVSSDHWAMDAINIVAENGWMIGDGNRTFRPDDRLTRAETATTLNRVLGRKVASVRVNDNPFKDLSANHWAFADLMEAATSHVCVVDKNGNEEWKSHEYPYLAE